MILESNRIDLRPLTIEEMKELIRDARSFQLSLGLQPDPIDMEPDWLKEMFIAFRDISLARMMDQPKDAIRHTLWMAIHREDQKWIGGIGSNGFPDENGEVEVGYFIDRNYRGKGFATEILELYLNFLLATPGLKRIRAHIPLDHPGSSKVVQKAGFKVDSQVEDEGMIVNKWVLENPGVIRK